MTFELCLSLGGMTVGEMRQRMSSAEFTKWIVFLNEKGRREAKAMKRAHQRAGR